MMAAAVHVARVVVVRMTVRVRARVVVPGGPVRSGGGHDGARRRTGARCAPLVRGQPGALLAAPPGRRSPMTLTTLLIIVLVIALLGGGGYYWRRW
jgi:hypothetical protein